MTTALSILWIALGCAWLASGARELLGARPGNYVCEWDVRGLWRSFQCVVLASAHAVVGVGYAYGRGA